MQAKVQATLITIFHQTVNTYSIQRNNCLDNFSGLHLSLMLLLLGVSKVNLLLDSSSCLLLELVVLENYYTG